MKDNCLINEDDGGLGKLEIIIFKLFQVRSKNKIEIILTRHETMSHLSLHDTFASSLRIELQIHY